MVDNATDDTIPAEFAELGIFAAVTWYEYLLVHGMTRHYHEHEDGSVSVRVHLFDREEHIFVIPPVLAAHIREKHQ